jgi:hypothetical protein
LKSAGAKKKETCNDPVAMTQTPTRGAKAFLEDANRLLLFHPALAKATCPLGLVVPQQLLLYEQTTATGAPTLKELSSFKTQQDPGGYITPALRE